jgi:hypothetical protein
MRRRTVLALLPLVLACGCTQQLISAAQRDCTRFGFTAGTPEYADCTQRSFERRQALLMDGLDEMSASGRYARPAVVQPIPVAPSGNGVLDRSYVSGLNRICVYNRMGSENAVTIPATSLCPLW